MSEKEKKLKELEKKIKEIEDEIKKREELEIKEFFEFMKFFMGMER